MLNFETVSKSFPNDIETIHVLKNISFRIETGEFVAIMGPSGSGKSTLLGVAAGLDKPDTGSVILDDVDLTKEDESNLASLRAKKIGFIFQNFQLLPGLTAVENVGIPLFLDPTLSEKKILEKAKSILDSVAMGPRANHFPKQLSGGEEQRVAIARSFVNDPKIIFADEPTANLDSKNSQTILDLLLYRNQEQGTTIIVVTHDPDVAKLADRILYMHDGEIVKETRNKAQKKNQKNTSLSSKNREGGSTKKSQPKKKIQKRIK